jgi:hypothetical protein
MSRDVKVAVADTATETAVRLQPATDATTQHLDECWWVTDHGWPCICDRIQAGRERLRSDIRAAVDALGRDSTQTRRTLISSVLTAIDDPHRYI